MKKITFLALTAALALSIGAPRDSASAKEKKSSNEPIVTYEKVGNLELVNYEWKEPVKYDYKNEDVVSAQYIPYDGKEYHMSTKSLYKAKSWGTTVTNDSTVNDSVTKTVSRKTFATGTIGASYETSANFALIKGKVGISGEVSWGTDTTTTVTYTWNLPARTKTTIATGSEAVYTSGTIIEYRDGREYKRTSAKADYSFDEYADKVSNPL